MRHYKEELEKRTAFIRDVLRQAGASGIVFGNSGGKDSALTGILCKAACENTVGIVLPCESERNYSTDRNDALAVAARFGIETRNADLSPVKLAVREALSGCATISGAAASNINPRLRMTVLYTVAAGENRLVAGTGNRSETYLGYFTKWGDGACDLNPIADLTATEIYEFLRYLNCPDRVITKAPSAALYEGQTDESEFGFTYAELDKYLLTGEGPQELIAKIEARHKATAHKRKAVLTYPL